MDIDRPDGVVGGQDGNPYHYRDFRTEGVVEDVFNVIPADGMLAALERREPDRVPYSVGSPPHHAPAVVVQRLPEWGSYHSSKAEP